MQSTVTYATFRLVLKQIIRRALDSCVPCCIHIGIIIIPVCIKQGSNGSCALYKQSFEIRCGRLRSGLLKRTNIIFEEILVNTINKHQGQLKMQKDNKNQLLESS